MAAMNDPISTYRIQFHKGFTFKDFKKIIPYLHQLGIKTIYASPIFESTPGSTHGYDVTDPLKINPEIGTLSQLEAISRELKTMGIGWLQDIVPNHMAFHSDNKWLTDVLEKGQQSDYADFFDIQWDSPVYGGRLMVPFLEKSFEESLKELEIVYTGKQLNFASCGQNYPLNLRSYLTLLQYVDNQIDFSEFAGEIGALQEKKKSQSYTIHYDELKSKYQRLFKKTFTRSFLKKVSADTDLLKTISAEQSYQLCHWQETEKQINYRRFFTVNGLICLNMHHEQVFVTYHQLIKSLLNKGIFQGLRVDHIDGLYDPEYYLKQLRNLAGERTFIVVEKILENGELFPENWPVQGNTGYDFLGYTNNLLTDRHSKKLLSKLYSGLTHGKKSVEQRVLNKKSLILHQYMGGELENLRRLFTELKLVTKKELKGVSSEHLKAAIAELLIRCPVYRFYGNTSPLPEDESVALQDMFEQIKQSEPQLEKAIGLLEKVLIVKIGNGKASYKQRVLRFYRRCMQFTGPLMAKGVEDTLMYTYNRFIDHNEVGDSPASFGIKVPEFHRLMIKRQKNWPLSVNASSTHDTKRGEDVRSRLNVISERAEHWLKMVKTWVTSNAILKENNMPDVNDEYFIYQTIAGTYQMPGEPDDDFENRLQEYLVNALREAKRNSQWAQPNEVYEHATKKFISALLAAESDFMRSFIPFYTDIVDHGILNSLVQVVLKFTCPGVPDLYQGCEGWDLSMVDPDNRRPVDYKKRKVLLLTANEQSAEYLWQTRYNAGIKIHLTQQLLTIRSQNCVLFSQGEYIPLKVKGKYKKNILAFARHYQTYWIVVVVPLHLAAICKDDDPLQFSWKNTRIILPANAPLKWKHLLCDANGFSTGALLVDSLFKALPLAVLQLEKPNNGRNAGILMHITALPSRFGIGDIGAGARAFVDFLSKSRQNVWQMLPVNPVDKLAGYSPYSSSSSMAGNGLLISPDLLVRDGLLSSDDLEIHQHPDKNRVDFDQARRGKEALVQTAYHRYVQNGETELTRLFGEFKARESYWLDDFALYWVIKDRNNGEPWYKWSHEFKMRDRAVLESFKTKEALSIEQVKWVQFIFHMQWKEFKAYCEGKNITLLGDLPFYISYDSVDVWSNPRLFDLNDDATIRGIAGVPPDYFSTEGQLWGMPVYDWAELKRTSYKWWIERIKKNLELVDMIRLDHFRAFADYWEVGGGETTAINGRWKKGPGSDFFNHLKKELGKLPFVAEDLGDISRDVIQLKEQFNLPGMKVLQFGFDANMPMSDHIPHNHTENNFCFTGTHDNNTTLGWYKNDIGKAVKKRLNEYTGKKIKDKNVSEIMIKLAYASVAKTTIIPMQDVSGLDGNGRMNTPSLAEGNWVWRLNNDSLTHNLAKRLRRLTIVYNR